MDVYCGGSNLFTFVNNRLIHYAVQTPQIGVSFSTVNKKQCWRPKTITKKHKRQINVEIIAEELVLYLSEVKITCQSLLCTFRFNQF